jgi:hypothetical protein
VKPGQLLIVLLVLASLAVDAVVIASRGFIYPTNLFTYPLPISQIGLLALWAGLGQTPFWIRLPSLVVGAALWSWILRQGEGSIADQWFLVLSVEGTLTLALLLIVRLLGVGLKRIDSHAAAAKSEEDFRLRFSLRDVFVLVTAVCVCLGGMPLLVENWQSVMLGVGGEPMLLTYSGAWAVLSMLATWLALGGRHVVLRGVSCLMLVAAMAMCTVIGLETQNERGVAWITAEHLLLTFSSLLVLRLCGYRMVNRRAK